MPFEWGFFLFQHTVAPDGMTLGGMGLGSGGAPAGIVNNPFDSALGGAPKPAVSAPGSGGGGILRGSALGKVETPPSCGAWPDGHTLTKWRVWGHNRFPALGSML